MKIAVVAANGKAGRLIVQELVGRGEDVTAITRGENKTDAQNSIQKDIMDLMAADLGGFDAVVDAFGTWAPERSISIRRHSRISATFFPERTRAFSSSAAREAFS